MSGLENVLWIGGPPGSGKSTVAQRVARRHGLRWYNSDAHTWAHRDRALAAGNPAAARWEVWRATPPAERPALTAAEMLAMSLHVDRGPMTVDDLRALPKSPLIVAEGTQITPRMLPPGSQAVWLMPSSRVQRARLEERHKPLAVPELYLLLGQIITAEVDDANARKIVVDDLTPVETVAAVERLFADTIAAGPRATIAQERRQLLRYANRATVAQMEAGFARPWATGDVAAAVRSFLCECAQPTCVAVVDLPIGAFPGLPDATSPPVLAAGHQVSGDRLLDAR